MSPLDPQVIHRVGWALVHFVWQGAALAALAAVMLRCLRRRTAAVRYLAACTALAAMVAVPAATLCLVPPAPTVTHRATGDGIPRSETPAAVVWTSVPADAPAVPASGRNESWAAGIAPAIESALPQMVLAWLTGALAVSIWYAGGWVWVRRLIWKRSQPAAERWRQVAADLARRMRVSRPVRILESAAVRVPTLIGCLRPVILLPVSVLTGMAPGEIEALLAHELAHVRRWDYLVNLLQTLAESLLFYHPAVWWLSRRIRVEREQCCDDVVVATCGDRVAYARALAALEESRATPVPALAARGGRLLARIRRILAMESEKRSSAGWLAGSAALAGIALAAVAVLTAACGLYAAGWAGAANPSGEATQSAAAGGEVIRRVTLATKALPVPASRAQDPLAAADKSPAGEKHILIEARLIQVPADAKEKVEAGLAGVRSGVLSGSGLLSREQAEAFLAHVDTIQSVHTLAAPNVTVVENQQAQVFVGENRPLSLPLVGAGAPAADKAGIRTTVIFPVGARVSVAAALSPDGHSIALKAEQCVNQLDQKGGHALLTEGRGEVQAAVPFGQWLLLRVSQKSYRLTAISQKDDPASGKISMEVLREPLPDAGRAPYDIWVLLRPSRLAQVLAAAAGTANAEAAKAPIVQVVARAREATDGSLKGPVPAGASTVLTAKPAGSSASRGFSPEVEQVVPHLPEGAGNSLLLDLDTGQWSTNANFDVGPDIPSRQREWLRRTGADLAATPDPKFPILIGYDIVFSPADNKAWETATAADVWNDRALMTAERQETSFADKSEGAPDTFLFRTREGGRGILQVLGNRTNPPGVKIRYKMVGSSERPQ